MEGVIAGFEVGLFHHEDLAEIMQSFYRFQAEMKSADRDKYIQYLKQTGEYDGGYDE